MFDETMSTHMMKIIGTNKIKYDILDEIFGENYIDTDKVNIHIDLNTILKPLYDKNIDKQLDGDNRYHISSSILNLVAHFRAYFVYRQKISTRFFLYYTNKELKNGCKYFKQFIDKELPEVTHAVKKGLDLVELISKYCEDVYYISTNAIEPVVAARHFTEKYNSKGIKNLVLTKDEMWYQLINYKHADILRLKRDESILITNKNIYEFLLKDSKYESNILSSKLLSVVYAYTGMKTRNIQGIKGIGKSKIIKQLEKEINLGSLLNDYFPKIEHLFDDIRLQNQEDAIYNYYLIDLENSFKKLSIVDIEHLNNCIINKFSKNDLMMLNTRYYTGELSLMLNELVISPDYCKKCEW